MGGRKGKSSDVVTLKILLLAVGYIYRSELSALDFSGITLMTQLDFMLKTHSIRHEKNFPSSQPFRSESQHYQL